MEAEWEREREREGGPGVAWISVAAWRRRGSGPAVSRAGSTLPHDSGERRGRCDVDQHG
jgi:hypothetical protein